MRCSLFFFVAFLALGCPKGGGGSRGVSDPDATLAFVAPGQPARTFTERELEAAVPVETVTVQDPYYKKQKTFRALPLGALLARGFPGLALEREELVLRARDGFTVPVPGARLLERGAWIAVADVEVPDWEPIGPQRVSPGPFYLVWSLPGQEDTERYPRPWQLASIEIARFDALFPHVAPRGLEAGAPAMKGFALFRVQCLPCHAINREGGRVGPDLNVPQSIVEYRPEAQIRAYIKDPLTFRYGTMPAHPHLGEADLDGIIAYFHAMKARKHDPEREVR